MSVQDDSPQQLEFLVSAEDAGRRLDVFLAARLPQYSRVNLRRAIQADGVTVNGDRTKVAYRLCEGQRVVVQLPEMPRESPIPENLPLDILHEDESFVVINKAAGMVVHPAKGHWSGTLTSALAYHFQQLSEVGGPTRPGIVHRLDRETSGVMVVAKTDAGHLAIAEQFEARTVEKEYFAITIGAPDRDADVIEQPIGPHPHHREKMAIRAGHRLSRPARTFYQVASRFSRYGVIRAFPKTGRTHQIRVHLTHIGHPILCDRLYGGRSQITYGELRGQTPDGDIALDRLALHARRLRFRHPTTGKEVEFEAPLPEDLIRTVKAIEEAKGSSSIS